MKKEFRVKRNEDFSKIIARKKSFANSCFIIYKDENQMDHNLKRCIEKTEQIKDLSIKTFEYALVFEQDL